MILRQAYKAIRPGVILSKENFSLDCYPSDKYDQPAARGESRGPYAVSSYVVVGRGEYTLHSNEPDRGGAHWFSWSTSTPEEFVRKYHHDKILGDFPLYTIMIMAERYGPRYDAECLLQGRREEYEEKKQQIQHELVGSLDRYFQSFSYRAILFLLKRCWDSRVAHGCTRSV